ncbi:MAG: cyclic nucleotide-binding domain-containing protein [Gammaproteobacteria bacterium]|nr:cyclic nucleotide-binding domain-containing protein [Gammaproteobacteria bacterium]
MKSPPQERLDSAVLNRFLAHCRTREVPARNMIIKVNELADSLFYLLDGSVEVIIEDDAGRDMILAYLNQGHFFGELGFFDQNQATRSAWVRARSHCVVVEMSYEKFQQLTVDDPSLVVEIATQIAVRLFSTDLKLGDLAFVDVTGRVAHALLDLCNEPDARAVEDGWEIHITRPQLARLVGCSREMVCRVLKTLHSDGLIYDHNGGIVVRNRHYAADVA